MGVIILAPHPEPSGNGGGTTTPPPSPPSTGGTPVVPPPIVTTPHPPPRFDPEPAWAGLRMFLDAPGRSWDLTGDSGLLLTRGGLRGLHHPGVTPYSHGSPALAGARYAGQVVNVREVFWPALIYSDAGSAAWVEHDAALWRALEPGREVVWRVVGIGGAERTLSMVVGSTGDYAYDLDPVKFGWSAHGIEFTAYDPFWYGPAIRRTWIDEARRAFYGANGAPPFYISSSSTLSNASITNPGDVESYITWTIFGPTTNIEVGVGSRLIKAPFAVGAGQALVIDPSPGAQSAILYPASAGNGVVDTSGGGQDVTPQLVDPPDWQGSTVASRATVTLVLNIEALGGYVVSAMRPAYYRGFPR